MLIKQEINTLRHAYFIYILNNNILRSLYYYNYINFLCTFTSLQQVSGIFTLEFYFIDNNIIHYYTKEYKQLSVTIIETHNIIKSILWTYWQIFKDLVNVKTLSAYILYLHTYTNTKCTS
jgi:hypothetical protein